MTEPTLLLQRVREGDPDACDELFEVLRHEIHGVAHAVMQDEAREVTVQASVLVSELYLNVRGALERGFAEDRGKGDIAWPSREDFLRYAAACMRSFLVDVARRRAAAKRGGDVRRVALTDDALRLSSPSELTLFLDDACSKLAEGRPVHAELLSLVRFGGLSPRQAGRALGLARRETEDVWAFARAWLAREWGVVDGD
ncbi:MAG: ECF-type sigma factor [Planctomycetota bacterium]